MILVNVTFGDLSDAEFENRLQNIVLQLKNKTIFPNPFEGLDALEASAKVFSEALVQAMDGSRLAKARKNAARKEATKLLKKAAYYVAMVAGDDVTIVIAGGFDPRKPREPRSAVVAPENITLESGANPGEIIVSVKPVDGVLIYHYEYTTDPLSDISSWITEPDTRSSHLISGLKPGQKYWFRVAAVGVRGTTVYSLVVWSYVK